MLKVAAECHLHGLVHRDMKPEVCRLDNIFVWHGTAEYCFSSDYIHFLQNFLFKSPKADSHLKATDFGLSDFIRPGDLMLSDIFA